MSDTFSSNLMVGNVVVAFLIGGVGLWAATTNISGAVIAPGSLVVDSNVKKVQHQTGGTVKEILVQNGDVVKEGDVLLRLDETINQASVSILDKDYAGTLARKIRLEAERDEKSTLEFPKEIAKQSSVADERKLFESSRMARMGQKEQLLERIEQLEEEIRSYENQIQSKTDELEFLGKELEGVRKLFKRGLTTIMRLNALERDNTRVRGERAQLQSAISQAKGKIAETNLQILQIDKEFKADVLKELREIEIKLGQTTEKRVAAKDQLTRVNIRAPQAGIVDQSIVHTVGGVVNPGEVLMIIVPKDSLVVEAKINPNDVSKVKYGQNATLRFTSFNSKTTPEIEGKVTFLSANTETDPKYDRSYYTTRIMVEPDQQAKLGNVKLVPGMPVETFIKTEERTVLSYLVKPLSDQIYHAFREQ